MFTPYRYFDHPSGTGIEARGKTREAAFENAACAMFAVMTHPSLILPERRVGVDFVEAEPARALGEWLNRLLGQARLAGLVLGSFQLTREGDHYTGEGWGMTWKKGAERGIQLQEVVPGLCVVEQQGKHWLARGVVEVCP